MATIRRSRPARAGLSLAAAGALGLLITSTALAGGWASATLDEQPSDPGAGGTVTLGFTLLQHGVTPVDWGEPLVTLADSQSGAMVSAVARPSGKAGHWIAEVRVPTAGTWTLDIRHDLEIAPMNFEPIIVGGGASAEGATGVSLSPALATAAAFTAMLLLAAGALGYVTWRRRAGQLPA